MIVDLIAIGKRIKYLRESFNLSQVEIADYLSLDQKLINEIEQGKINISSDTIYKLYILFCCNTDYLLFGNNINDECNIFNVINSLLLNNVDIQSIATLNKIVLNQFEMDKMLKLNAGH